MSVRFIQGVVDMRLRFTVSILAILLAVVAAGTATAQERFGGIAGIVTDSSQAPVPGVTITATNKQTGAQKVAVTGTDGVSHFRSRSWAIHGDRRTSRIPESPGRR